MGATCLALVLWVVLVMAKYVRITLNIFVDTPPPLGMGPRDFKRLEGHHVQFRSFDGATLRGMWLWPAPNVQSKGTIVFCHEFQSDMYSVARYGRALLDGGFTLFSFDFRGHGESPCPEGYKPLQWVSDKEVGDLLGATSYVVSHLTEKGLPAEIGLFGISRGGAAAVLAAASDDKVKAVLCDSAYSTEEVCIGLMKRWAHIFARVRLAYENHPEFFWRLLARLVTWCAQRRMGCKYPSVKKTLPSMTPRPIMFIHGRRDSYIPVQQSLRLHQLASEPKRMLLVADAKHNQSVIVAPGEYARQTLAFFQKYLATVETGAPAPDTADDTIGAPVASRSL